MGDIPGFYSTTERLPGGDVYSLLHRTKQKTKIKNWALGYNSLAPDDSPVNINPVVAPQNDRWQGDTRSSSSISQPEIIEVFDPTAQPDANHQVINQYIPDDNMRVQSFSPFIFLLGLALLYSCC